MSLLDVLILGAAYLGLKEFLRNRKKEKESQ